jgi:hypothetical protein
MLQSRKSFSVNRLAFISTFLMLFVLAALCVAVEPVYAQFDFNAFRGNAISDGDIDGVIGNEWDDTGNYANVAIGPQGTAKIWTKNDGSNLYLAVQFTADSDNPWVAFQFGFSSHMSSGADGALFGHDRLGANEYRDISFGGLGSISVDGSQDGVGAISVGNSNIVTVEMKKPLDSEDSVGKDIDWTVGDIYTWIIMWDSNGGGSSGGDNSHTNAAANNRTIFINANQIPEFSGLTFIVALVATSVVLLILKKSSKFAGPKTV